MPDILLYLIMFILCGLDIYYYAKTPVNNKWGFIPFIGGPLVYWKYLKDLGK